MNWWIILDLFSLDSISVLFAINSLSFSSTFILITSNLVNSATSIFFFALTYLLDMLCSCFGNLLVSLAWQHAFPTHLIVLQSSSIEFRYVFKMLTILTNSQGVSLWFSGTDFLWDQIRLSFACSDPLFLFLFFFPSSMCVDSPGHFPSCL